SSPPVQLLKEKRPQPSPWESSAASPKPWTTSAEPWLRSPQATQTVTAWKPASPSTKRTSPVEPHSFPSGPLGAPASRRLLTLLLKKTELAAGGTPALP